MIILGVDPGSLRTGYVEGVVVRADLSN